MDATPVLEEMRNSLDSTRTRASRSWVTCQPPRYEIDGKLYSPTEAQCVRAEMAAQVRKQKKGRRSATPPALDPVRHFAVYA